MELTQARATAERLIAIHVPQYRFEWSDGKTVLGHCDYRARAIRLSRTLTLVNDERQTVDTILHEIAHAKAGAGAGHGATWKRIARELGAVPRATAQGAVSVRETAPWVGHCPSCGHVSTAKFFRKPRVNRSCASCYPGAYHPAYRLVYTRQS